MASYFLESFSLLENMKFWDIFIIIILITFYKSFAKYNFYSFVSKSSSNKKQLLQIDIKG